MKLHKLPEVWNSAPLLLFGAITREGRAMDVQQESTVAEDFPGIAMVFT
jgi:hypothetical protein